jgi:rsbT co-antagonist protein RsbR
MSNEGLMQKTQQSNLLSSILEKHESSLLDEWIKAQMSSSSSRSEHISESALRQPCKEFLGALQRGIQSDSWSLQSPSWADVRSFLGDLSRTRALQGFSPVETATFVFSFKQALFSRLRKEVKEIDTLGEQVWLATELLDQLGLYTTEIYQRSREEVIRRQQQEMMELSTPVIRIWEGVLAIPLIGTLDSSRTQMIMENLLQTIVETNSKIAILDITGVPTVDTQTAQHLIKTVSAARLMGAECIISGIRPQIAQTIVHLGIEITDVSTKASMADAVLMALSRQGWQITRR